MSDLVNRLRAYAYDYYDEGAQGCIYWVAADRIEALESQLAAADRLASEVDTFCDERCIHSTDGIYAYAVEYFEARK